MDPRKESKEMKNFDLFYKLLKENELTFRTQSLVNVKVIRVVLYFLYNYFKINLILRFIKII
jgi:hypothetical protein